MIYVTKGLNDKNSNASTSAEFVIKKPGVYRIEVTKKTKDGKEYSAEIYRSFSYSAEYDEMDDPDLYPEDEEAEEAAEGGEDEE